jgi:hypothetical protein
MTEDKPIRCDECGQIVGMLTKSAHGGREETVTGNDLNCDYPPVITCPDAKLAFSRARRIEVLEEMQEKSAQPVQDQRGSNGIPSGIRADAQADYGTIPPIASAE